MRGVGVGVGGGVGKTARGVPTLGTVFLSDASVLPVGSAIYTVASAGQGSNFYLRQTCQQKSRSRRTAVDALILPPFLPGYNGDVLFSLTLVPPSKQEPRPTGGLRREVRCFPSGECDGLAPVESESRISYHVAAAPYVELRFPISTAAVISMVGSGRALALSAPYLPSHPFFGAMMNTIGVARG